MTFMTDEREAIITKAFKQCKEQKAEWPRMFDLNAIEAILLPLAGHCSSEAYLDMLFKLSDMCDLK
jgi:hypothetical protein